MAERGRRRTAFPSFFWSRLAERAAVPLLLVVVALLAVAPHVTGSDPLLRGSGPDLPPVFLGLPLVPAVVGIVVTAALKGVVGLLVASLIGSIVSVGLGFAIQALQKKPDQAADAGNFVVEAQRRTQTIRTSTPPVRVVVGFAKLGGFEVFYQKTGAGSDFLHHRVVFLCEGPVTAIDPVWIGDVPVYAEQLDADGNVTSGPFTDKLTLRVHLGAEDQAADAALASNTDVTTEFRGRGKAYIYAIFDWDIDTWPNGLPNISALVHGIAMTDPRDAVSRWSHNPALAIDTYWRNDFWGRGIAPGRLSEEHTIAAANTCDEIVDVAHVTLPLKAVDATADTLEFFGQRIDLQTGDRGFLTAGGTAPGGLTPGDPVYVILKRPESNDELNCAVQVASSYANAIEGTPVDITSAGSGGASFTKTGEPRYQAAGVLDFGDGPDAAEVTEDLLTAMAGRLAYVAGTVRMFAGAYFSPTVTLTESDIIGPMRVQNKVSRRDRYNRLIGTFVSPAFGFQPSDYPMVRDVTGEGSDGGPILRTLDLPLTSRVETAQRLGKIDLQRARRPRSVELVCNLRALQLVPGDTVALTLPRRGWSAFTFEVVAVAFIRMTDRRGGPILAVRLQLRETDANVFTVGAVAEATVLPPTQRSSHRSPFDPPQPISVRVQTQGSGAASRILLTWTAPQDPNVQVSGEIEIEHRKSADTAWLPAFRVPASVTTAVTPLVSDATDYDVRLRAVSILGDDAGVSPWLTFDDFTVGSDDMGASVTEDWGLVAEAAGSSEDYAGVADATSESEDYGSTPE